MVKLTDFIKKTVKRRFLRKGFPNTGFTIFKKVLDVWIVLDHKNDTNTPEFLALRVLEVRLGLGWRGKEPTTFTDFKSFPYNKFYNLLRLRKVLFLKHEL